MPAFFYRICLLAYRANGILRIPGFWYCTYNLYILDFGYRWLFEIAGRIFQCTK